MDAVGGLCYCYLVCWGVKRMVGLVAAVVVGPVVAERRMS